MYISFYDTLCLKYDMITLFYKIMTIILTDDHHMSSN